MMYHRPTTAELADRDPAAQAALATKIDGTDHLAVTIGLDRRCTICGRRTFGLQVADAERMIRAHSRVA